jgi:YHS domain-containing protein/thioredoxin-related protein
MKPVLSWLSCAAAVMLAAVAPAFAEEGLRWEADLPSAQRLARQTDRLVLIHFGGPWCQACQMLERNVFSQPGFGRELTADYVAVKIDSNSSAQNREIATKYGVETVPCDVITTPSGQLVYRIASPNTASNYVATLANAAALTRPDRQTPPPQAQPAGPAPAQVATRPTDDRYPDRYSRGQTVEREPYQPPVQNRTVQQPSPPTDRYADRDLAQSRYPQQGRYPQQSQGGVPSAGQSPAASDSRYAAAEAQRQGEMQRQVAIQAAGTQPSTAGPPADAEQPIELKIPPGSPPLALEGYCPVTLVESNPRRWQIGDPNIGAIHRGMLYLFATQESQQKFMANPDHYSPVLRGHDPVLALDKNQAVPGRREFGVFSEGRIYLFSSAATREHFENNSRRYSADLLQAMR